MRVLVVDDDLSQRTLYACLFERVPGIDSIVLAADGLEAQRVASELPVDVAILDLHMPRLDGVETALALRAAHPALRIALHSSEPAGLRARAQGLAVPLFSKGELEPLADWVEAQALAAAA